MAVLGTTIVNVALPSIAQGIKASSDALEWVVSGYTLAFVLAAWLCTFGLPRTLSADRAAENQ
jgi:MFS family permease